jgi:hypothetical protein
MAAMFPVAATVTSAHHVHIAHILVSVHRRAAVRILTKDETSEAEDG